MSHSVDADTASISGHNNTHDEEEQNGRKPSVREWAAQRRLEEHRKLVRQRLEKYAAAFGLMGPSQLPQLTEPGSPLRSNASVAVDGREYPDFLRATFRLIHRGTKLATKRDIAEYVMARDVLKYAGIEPSSPSTS